MKARIPKKNLTENELSTITTALNLFLELDVQAFNDQISVNDMIDPVMKAEKDKTARFILDSMKTSPLRLDICPTTVLGTILTALSFVEYMLTYRPDHPSIAEELLNNRSDYLETVDRLSRAITLLLSEAGVDVDAM